MALIFAIILVLLFGLESVGASHQGVSTPSNRKHDQPTKVVSDTIITVVGGWAERNKDVFDAFSTLAVAVFTFTLWRATVLLFKAGEAQRAHAEAAHRDQMEATQASLAIAKQSAEAAILTAKATMAGQRALVSATPYFAPGATGAGYNFGARWDNIGNLSTANFSNYIDFMLGRGKNLPARFVFPDNVQPLARGSLIAPKRFLMGPHIPKKGDIPHATINAMMGGTRTLFIFGWARYFDGFPDTEERVTRFCYRVRPTGNIQMPFVFEPTDQYNDAT